MLSVLVTHSGLTVPAEVRVGLAVLVLPATSALDPLLYTLGRVAEQRSAARKTRLVTVLTARLKAQGALEREAE